MVTAPEGRGGHRLVRRGPARRRLRGHLVDDDDDGAASHGVHRRRAASPRTATTATTLPSHRTATAPPSGAVGAQASTSSECSATTCTVRVACDEVRHVRRGPAPVATRSFTVNARTTITLDFAGAARDTTIRC